MKCPESIQDIESLIRDQVQESIHLDYKALVGKHDEISKDVSAFANADGGVIVYGVQEVGHLPVAIAGLEHAAFTREQLESIIQSNIAPPLDDVLIRQLPIDALQSVFVVCVRKSLRAPHQDRKSKRYYKRYNFQSVPMEDYEIQDIRNRIRANPSLIDVDLEIDRGAFIKFVIKNIGDSGASDIKFEFSDTLTWKRECPTQLKKGIAFLAKGKRLAFLYNSVSAAFSKGSTVVKTFDVKVSYFNASVAQRVTETFTLDISDYDGTSVESSELARHGNEIRDAIARLGQDVQKTNRILEGLSTIAGPTGINLSVTTLRQYAQIVSKAFEPSNVNLRECSADALREILDISLEEACNLEDYLSANELSGATREVPGVSKKTVQKARKLRKAI